MRQSLTYLGLVLTIYAYITHLAGSFAAQEIGTLKQVGVARV